MGQALFMATMTASAGIAVWAVTDACHRQVVEFRHAGYHRMSWILLLMAGSIVAFLVSPFGLVFAAAVGAHYLVVVRARVRNAGIIRAALRAGGPTDPASGTHASHR